MDRTIEHKKGVWAKLVPAAILTMLAAGGLFALVSHFSISRLTVDRDRLLVATVERAVLHDELGAPRGGEVVVLPKGAFFEKTGGHWVFLVDEAAGNARRQPVRLGLEDSRFYEVLSGLEPGDRVITSSYAHFADAELLVFEE